MNIVSLIMQFFGPAIVSKLASSLGINNSIAQKMIGAALPTILAAIVGKSAQPGGLKSLTDLLGKQDPALLGNLAGMIGGGQQKTMAEQGIGALGSLLGGNALGGLTSALGKFTGANDTATNGLLGMLAPALLGTLAQQQKSSNLDAGGLAKMLAGQKDNIAAAMPADFAKMLGGTGLLDAIGPNLASLTSGAKPAPAAAAPASHTPAPAKSFNWWPWALRWCWSVWAGGTGSRAARRRKSPSRRLRVSWSATITSSTRWVVC